MGLTSAQVKGKIKNIASKNGADPRVLMRIYMMERFLERVSLSAYKDNFIIKGGMLITSMVGISVRSTMDIDTTVKGQDLSLENAQRIVREIADIQIDDGVSFIIKDVETIMDEMTVIEEIVGHENEQEEEDEQDHGNRLVRLRPLHDADV